MDLTQQTLGGYWLHTPPITSTCLPPAPRHQSSLSAHFVLSSTLCLFWPLHLVFSPTCLPPPPIFRHQYLIVTGFRSFFSSALPLPPLYLSHPYSISSSFACPPPPFILLAPHWQVPCCSKKILKKLRGLLPTRQQRHPEVTCSFMPHFLLFKIKGRRARHIVSAKLNRS